MFELLNRVPGEFPVQEVQRLAEVIVDGRAIATVVELAKAREEVFRLFVLRFVYQTLVGDSLCPANLVDPNDHWLEALPRAHNLQIHQNQPKDHQRQQRHRKLQIAAVTTADAYASRES